jgi:Tol biopolymer transport system component
MWTPDGKKIVYTSTSGMGVYYKAADGTGERELLFNQPMLAGSWTSNGNVLACTAAMHDIDVYLVAINGDRKPKPYLNSEHGECCPSFSPDGRFMAYNSSETGRAEIFVRSYSDKNGGKWQISTEGGFMPIWSRDGREIFFTKVTKMYVVDVTTEPVFKASAPRLLIEGPYDFRTVADLNYDISPDGQKIVAVEKSGISELKQINIILNWDDEVRRRTSQQPEKSNQ